MNETLGQQLRAWRLGEGLTQGDVARRLGVSVQYVCDIEHDKRLVYVQHDPPITRKIKALIGLRGEGQSDASPVAAVLQEAAHYDYN